ncbi:MAG: hypothetical protein P8Z35_14845 [Ignavibacteriaceae bacterium]
MKKILLLLFFLSTYSFAYTYLYVQDPRNWGGLQQGTIEEAVVSLKPLGIYMQTDLYLTFSARNTSYSSLGVTDIPNAGR